MNRYLLDTNVVLLILADDARLTPAIRKAVASGSNLLSVASYWEVVIKSAKGKLNVGDPRIWWTKALHQLVAMPLHIRPEHIDAVYNLPPIHKDPFDRMLIAQAIAADLTLVTTDATMARYRSANLAVIQ